MDRTLSRRTFWPTFVGVVVAMLATKTAYPSIHRSLNAGLIAAVYVLTAKYAVTESNTAARWLRALVITCTILFIVYSATGLAWSLIPWGAALFAVACLVFLRKKSFRSKHTSPPAP